MNGDTLDALARAHRLETLGITVRSEELAADAKRLREFAAAGGNRAMRRAAAKQDRSKRRR